MPSKLNIFCFHLMNQTVFRFYIFLKTYFKLNVIEHIHIHSSEKATSRIRKPKASKNYTRIEKYVTGEIFDKFLVTYYVGSMYFKKDYCFRREEKTVMLKNL